MCVKYKYIYIYIYIYKCIHKGMAVQGLIFVVAAVVVKEYSSIFFLMDMVICTYSIATVLSFLPLCVAE